MIYRFVAFFTDYFKTERELVCVTELSYCRNRTRERI